MVVIAGVGLSANGRSLVIELGRSATDPNPTVLRVENTAREQVESQRLQASAIRSPIAICYRLGSVDSDQSLKDSTSGETRFVWVRPGGSKLRNYSCQTYRYVIIRGSKRLLKAVR